jgi:hypothetical protein
VRMGTLTENDRHFIASRKVVNGGVYSVYVASDGTTILEDNDPSLFNDMYNEAQMMDAEKARDGTDASKLTPTVN